MRYNSFFLVLLAGLLLAACGRPAGESIDRQEPTAPPVAPTRPAPQVATSLPASPEASTTFMPIIESEATEEGTPIPEPTATATAEPTAPPASPVAAVELQLITTGGMSAITGLTHAFDERLFVLEQIGRIRIIEDGVLLEQPFLDITDRVGSFASEQGLLGLAFHPDYATPGTPMAGMFFVNYTDYNGNSHISRFSVTEDPNRADPASEVDYLTLNQPYENHNGGSLAFGPDGYLYAGFGDGGRANDPLLAGQDLSTLLGKVLRLDVDATADAYAIPPDNPFVGVEGARPEIWAFGLRNPWRFSFDRYTGDFFIADVGQSQYEEVNFQPAAGTGGENYGWNIMEASHCFLENNCDQSGLTLPIFEYHHSVGGCSVTGGYMYRGDLYPQMWGNYFVADYCTGIIWRLFPQDGTWLQDVMLDSDLVISSFGEDVNGEIYALDYRNGGIYRVAPGD